MDKNENSPFNFNSLTKDEKRWYDGIGRDFLQNSLYVRTGDTILDFGCRIGHYSIPAAQIIGQKGKVYALDMNHSAIDDMILRSQLFGVEGTIYPIKTAGEVALELETGIIDHFLFFDVIQGFIKTDIELGSLQKLFKEAKRVLKKESGKFVIYIAHPLKLTNEEIIKLISKDFTYVGEKKANLIHWDHLEEGKVLIFKN